MGIRAHTDHFPGRVRNHYFRCHDSPRIGLSMEFCVALMLVLLGVLNLTGVMRWITERLTPAKPAGPEPETLFLDRVVGRLGLYQTIRPLVVGLVHGLAGSAAVALLVLPLSRALCGRLPTCWYLVSAPWWAWRL